MYRGNGYSLAMWYAVCIEATHSYNAHGDIPHPANVVLRHAMSSSYAVHQRVSHEVMSHWLA